MSARNRRLSRAPSASRRHRALKLAGADRSRERALSRRSNSRLTNRSAWSSAASDYFTAGSVQTFLAADYTVSPQADRMGYRLTGPVLAHAKGYDIVSDGIVAGAVQVPGAGLPIVLMVDHQTIGGYPKIATVISADIPVIGRRKPGRPIRFVAVSVPEASVCEGNRKRRSGCTWKISWPVERE